MSTSTTIAVATFAMWVLAAGCGGPQIGTVSDVPERRVRVPLETGCGGVASDAITLYGVALRGKTLLIDVAHGGGCAEHTYRVCADEMVIETFPGQWGMTVVHDAHGDDCDAEQFRVLEVPVESRYDLVDLTGLEGRSFTVLVE